MTAGREGWKRTVSQPAYQKGGRNAVRNLSYLLHPPLLDETGLRATLCTGMWDGMVKAEQYRGFADYGAEPPSRA